MEAQMKCDRGPGEGAPGGLGSPFPSRTSPHPTPHAGHQDPKALCPWNEAVHSPSPSCALESGWPPGSKTCL